MPPFTPHDLNFGMRAADGSTWATGIGSQWQDVGGNLEKIGIWPKPWGAALGLPVGMPTWMASMPGLTAVALYTANLVGLWDQYGYWNWEYPGTGTADITDWALWLKTKW